jgi:hypothetical protein
MSIKRHYSDLEREHLARNMYTYWRKNRMSMRKFAKKIGTSHSVLSSVLSGNTPLNTDFILRCCQEASIQPSDISESLSAFVLVSGERVNG